MRYLAEGLASIFVGLFQIASRLWRLAWTPYHRMKWWLEDWVDERQSKADARKAKRKAARQAKKKPPAKPHGVPVEDVKIIPTKLRVDPKPAKGGWLSALGRWETQASMPIKAGQVIHVGQNEDVHVIAAPIQPIRGNVQVRQEAGMPSFLTIDARGDIGCSREAFKAWITAQLLTAGGTWLLISEESCTDHATRETVIRCEYVLDGPAAIRSPTMPKRVEG